MARRMRLEEPMEEAVRRPTIRMEAVALMAMALEPLVNFLLLTEVQEAAVMLMEDLAAAQGPQPMIIGVAAVAEVSAEAAHRIRIPDSIQKEAGVAHLMREA